MQCPDCSHETKHGGTAQTLVGYGDIEGHDHDDNCYTRRYHCTYCDNQWIESRRNRCPTPGCDWVGKDRCWCHPDPKVDEWSDPADHCVPWTA